jgi:hypothetical protein
MLPTIKKRKKNAFQGNTGKLRLLHYLPKRSKK